MFRIHYRPADDRPSQLAFERYDIGLKALQVGFNRQVAQHIFISLYKPVNAPVGIELKKNN
jgi:hypothetical protein